MDSDAGSVPRSPGTRLGRYELRTRLGRGGMGEVWEALLHGPEGFRKPVALKLLRAGPADDAARDALLAEARLGGRLQHPNVVGTLDLLRVDDAFAIAMEIVRGAPLSALAPLSGAGALDALAQAAAGLAHVHRAGLVHRDVKPQNLLLDRTGLVKLADLGVARLQGTVGGAAGTPGYMPPEQVDGREEPRSDLFAFGVTAIVLASGTRPFGTGPTALVRVRQVERLLRTPAFLAEVDAAAPGLGEIVRRCLRADPAERFASADELRTALLALRAPGGSLLDRLAEARPDLGVEPSSSLGTALGSDAPTVRIVRGNLPPSRDRFVGREAELAALSELVLAAPGVVTVLGPGGMGKTRLAIETARAVEPRVHGGAWFADLSEATSGSDVCRAVAQALGLVLDKGDPVARIGFALRGHGRAVLVLDNLEQVIEPAAELVVRWAALAPEATLLATSRVALREEVERRFALGPLPVAEGVELFAARARRPTDDRAEVAALVAELDGMPLAIELAAARTRLLAVAEIRRRLGDRLRMLAGGDRERPERQRSLRASLDGSWELLSLPARRALARLALFEGGFGPEGAVALLDGAALDLVTELADASLVRTAPGGERFSMLAVVRQYAAERLEADERGDAEVRHGAFVAQLGTPDALAALHGRGGPERLVALVAAHDDLVAACRRAVARGDVPVAVATAHAASEAFALRGPAGPDADLLDRVLALPLGRAERVRLESERADADLRAGRREEALDRLRRVLADADAVGLGGVTRARIGACLYGLGRPVEAEPELREAATALAATGNRRMEGVARVRLAQTLLVLGRLDEARTENAFAEAAFREIGGRVDLARAQAQLGLQFLDRGLLEDARQHLSAALPVLREAGHRREEGIVHVNLGIALAQLGRVSEARTCYELGLATARGIGDRANEGVALGNLGALCRDQGLVADAERHLRASIDAAREVGDRRYEGIALGNLAMVVSDQGRLEEARPLYEEALAVHRSVGNRRSEGVVLTNYATRLGAIGDRAAARELLLASLSIHREVRNVRFEGIAVDNLGLAALQEGRFAEAREHLEAGLALHRRGGNRQKIALARAFIAGVDRNEGRYDDARARLVAAVEELREIEDLRSVGIVLADLAEVEWASGHPDAARAAASEALALGRKTSDPSTEGDALTVLARFALPDPSARTTAREALAIARRLAQPVTLGHTLAVVAEVERTLGDADAAIAALREARACVLAIGAEPEWPVMRDLAEEAARLGCP